MPIAFNAPSLKSTQEKLKDLLVSSEEGLSRKGLASSLEPSSASRWVAYRDGYVVRFEEALRETFRSLFQVVEHRTVHRWVEEYCRTHLPISYNLAEVSRDFPEFLRRTKLGQKHPELVDLARLEWAIHVTFHAEWKTPVSKKAVKHVMTAPRQGTVLTLQPGLGFIRSKWNIFEMWKGRGQPKRKKSSLLIYRRGVTVMVVPLESDQSDLLIGIREGRTLEQAFDALPKRVTPQKVQKWFASWMRLGLITQISAQR